jgi:hypothetical protein
LSRPIIARLRSESHENDGITVRENHQRLLQQNLPIAAVSNRSKKKLLDHLVGGDKQPRWHGQAERTLGDWSSN